MGHCNFFNDLLRICLKPLSWCWNISNHFFSTLFWTMNIIVWFIWCFPAFYDHNLFSFFQFPKSPALRMSTYLYLLTRTVLPLTTISLTTRQIFEWKKLYQISLMSVQVMNSQEDIQRSFIQSRMNWIKQILALSKFPSKVGFFCELILIKLNAYLVDNRVFEAECIFPLRLCVVCKKCKRMLSSSLFINSEKTSSNLFCMLLSEGQITPKLSYTFVKNFQKCKKNHKNFKTLRKILEIPKNSKTFRKSPKSQMLPQKFSKNLIGNYSKNLKNDLHP